LIIEGAARGVHDASRVLGPGMIGTESGFLSGAGDPTERQRASRISGCEQPSRDIVAGAARIQMIRAKCLLPLGQRALALGQRPQIALILQNPDKLLDAKKLHGNQIGAEAAAMFPLARQPGFNRGSVYESLPDQYLTQSHNTDLIARRVSSRFFGPLGPINALCKPIIVKELRGPAGAARCRSVSSLGRASARLVARRLLMI
jgi:hypothetical protein